MDNKDKRSFTSFDQINVISCSSMISSEHILTIGPDFSSPKGGIAQCISTYRRTIFSEFKSLTNSCNGSGLKKIWKACSSLLLLIYILLSDKQIRIVHIHTASYNSFKRSSWYVKVAKSMGKKVVIHIHGGGFKEYYDSNKHFIDSVLDRCDALIALSPSWKTFFGEIGCQNVHVVPNIIESPVLKPVRKDGKFHLLYLGQIYKAKGIYDILELINSHHSEYVDRLVLDIGGGMYDVELLKQIIRDERMDDVVHFHGWVSGGKKQELLTLADAFILPSYSEGVPISILEAESYGLPVISTPVGGIPEILADGKNGFLITPGDKCAMKSAVDALMNSPGLRREMGEISKSMVSDNLPDSVEMYLKNVYGSICLSNQK